MLIGEEEGFGAMSVDLYSVIETSDGPEYQFLTKEYRGLSGQMFSSKFKSTRVDDWKSFFGNMSEEDFFKN
ncbi:MAG: hypothetical protein PF542_00080 [Nanoarchaeota archaeon]|jgi:hypothetical protein|nr:hypothetical protein [Nanoarchaeota archaeon]